MGQTLSVLFSQTGFTSGFDAAIIPVTMTCTGGSAALASVLKRGFLSALLVCQIILAPALLAAPRGCTHRCCPCCEVNADCDESHDGSDSLGPPSCCCCPIDAPEMVPASPGLVPTKTGAAIHAALAFPGAQLAIDKTVPLELIATSQGSMHPPPVRLHLLLSVLLI